MTNAHVPPAPQHAASPAAGTVMLTMLMEQTTATPAERTRHWNDVFRRTFVGGRVMLTPAVAALPEPSCRVLLRLVQAFDSFDADNDPHEEHDFGALEHAGERWFWKIDCYDAAMQFGSPDPSDPAVTTRVLTIMRADEY